MPIAGKKHSEVLVGDGVLFSTPVRLGSSSRKDMTPSGGINSGSSSKTRPPPSSDYGINPTEIDTMTTTSGSDSEPSLLSTDLPSDKISPATTPSRKRKSISTVNTSATKGSSTKKRTRMSIGTPGKATAMGVEREQDVAKRFVELEVTEVYRAIRKQTGALGGNAAGGAIYGEVTQASFQRIVDYMKEHCELSSASLFLDVGSGLGKPNFHVAIDPGVEVSYGIELEELRWHLSLHNLKSVLSLEINKHRRNPTMFTAGDITDAQTLNPFTHIYSFDVGFPPNVMDQLADIFNRSSAQYFASFHAPRKVIEMYGFEVENLGRVATSMAGSSEGHMCYFYRRVASSSNSDGSGSKAEKKNESSSKMQKKTKVEENEKPSTKESEQPELLHIDPLFRPGFDVLQRGRDGVLAWIVSFFGEEVYSGRTRRQKANSVQLRKRQERPMESYYRVIGKPHAETTKTPEPKKRRTQLVSAH